MTLWTRLKYKLFKIVPVADFEARHDLPDYCITDTYVCIYLTEKHEPLLGFNTPWLYCRKFNKQIRSFNGHPYPCWDCLRYKNET